MLIESVSTKGTGFRIPGEIKELVYQENKNVLKWEEVPREYQITYLDWSVLMGEDLCSF